MTAASAGMNTQGQCARAMWDGHADTVRQIQTAQSDD